MKENTTDFTAHRVFRLFVALLRRSIVIPDSRTSDNADLENKYLFWCFRANGLSASSFSFCCTREF